MPWFYYAATGAFGGLAVEAARLLATLEKARSARDKASDRRPLTVVLSTVIRAILGAGTAVIMASTGQINGLFGALWIGLSAPLIIEQLAQRSPVNSVIPSSVPTNPTEDKPAPEVVQTVAKTEVRPAEIVANPVSQPSVREVDVGVWESADRIIPTAAEPLYFTDSLPPMPSIADDLRPEFRSPD